VVDDGEVGAVVEQQVNSPRDSLESLGHMDGPFSKAGGATEALVEEAVQPVDMD
jgi:hypothetical protein